MSRTKTGQSVFQLHCDCGVLLLESFVVYHITCDFSSVASTQLVDSPAVYILCQCWEAFASSGSWHLCAQLVVGKICSPGAPLWGWAGGSANWDISDLVVILDGADAMFPAHACRICYRRDGKHFSVSSTTWRLIHACDIRKFLFTEGRV